MDDQSDNQSNNDLFADPNAFVSAIRDKGENSPAGAVSPAGATGRMQVMPGTASAPGFGIQPSNGTPEDTERVGQEYARMMLQRYSGNQVLASAAYNAGPGRVDQWLQDYGDPRTGKVTNAQWQSQIPIDETKNYVSRVTGLGQSSSGASGPTYTAANPLTIGGVNIAQGQTSAPNMQQLGQQVAGQPGNAAAGSGVSMLQALRLMSLLVPPTHKLQAVDYNPFAPGMPGAPPAGSSANG